MAHWDHSIVSKQLASHFKHSYGELITTDAHPFIRQAIGVARRLLNLPTTGVETPTMRLQDENMLALVCFRHFRIRAFATRINVVDGCPYVVALSSSAIHTVFELCAALWSNPKFLPGLHTGKLRAHPSIKQGITVPRGMERLFFGYETKSKTCNTDFQPDWLRATFDAMPKARKRMLVGTFQSAIEFIWLHELFHISDGHTDFVRNHKKYSRLGVLDEYPMELDVVAGKDRKEKLELIRAFEIRADRFAAGRIFQDDVSNNNTSVLTQFLGVLVVYISIYAHLHSRNMDTESTTHPPIWFRIYRILERLSHSMGSAKYKEIRQVIDQSVVDTANQYPVIGMLVRPLIDPAYDLKSACDEIESVAYAAYKKHANRLNRIKIL